MISTQIAGKVFCRDSFTRFNEIFEARVTIVDVVDMEFATNIFFS